MGKWCLSIRLYLLDAQLKMPPIARGHRDDFLFPEFAFRRLGVIP